MVCVGPLIAVCGVRLEVDWLVVVWKLAGNRVNPLIDCEERLRELLEFATDLDLIVVHFQVPGKYE